VTVVEYQRLDAATDHGWYHTFWAMAVGKALRMRGSSHVDQEGAVFRVVRHFVLEMMMQGKMQGDMALAILPVINQAARRAAAQGSDRHHKLLLQHSPGLAFQHSTTELSFDDPTLHGVY
jgi:hypothetical protein